MKLFRTFTYSILLTLAGCGTDSPPQDNWIGFEGIEFKTLGLSSSVLAPDTLLYFKEGKISPQTDVEVEFDCKHRSGNPKLNAKKKTKVSEKDFVNSLLAADLMPNLTFVFPEEFESCDVSFCGTNSRGSTLCTNDNTPTRLQVSERPMGQNILLLRKGGPPVLENEILSIPGFLETTAFLQDTQSQSTTQLICAFAKSEKVLLRRGLPHFARLIPNGLGQKSPSESCRLVTQTNNNSVSVSNRFRLKSGQFNLHVQEGTYLPDFPDGVAHYESGVDVRLRLILLQLFNPQDYPTYFKLTSQEVDTEVTVHTGYHFSRGRPLSGPYQSMPAKIRIALGGNNASKNEDFIEVLSQRNVMLNYSLESSFTCINSNPPLSQEPQAEIGFILHEPKTNPLFTLKVYQRDPFGKLEFYSDLPLKRVFEQFNPPGPIHNFKPLLAYKRDPEAFLHDFVYRGQPQGHGHEQNFNMYYDDRRGSPAKACVSH